MTELQRMGNRTGFYPASARDYLEPLQLLKGWVDQLVFCDLHKFPQDPKELRALRKEIAEQCLPEASPRSKSKCNTHPGESVACPKPTHT